MADQKLPDVLSDVEQLKRLLRRLEAYGLAGDLQNGDAAARTDGEGFPRQAGRVAIMQGSGAGASHVLMGGAGQADHAVRIERATAPQHQRTWKAWRVQAWRFVGTVVVAASMGAIAALSAVALAYPVVWDLIRTGQIARSGQITGVSPVVSLVPTGPARASSSLAVVLPTAPTAPSVESRQIEPRVPEASRAPSAEAASVADAEPERAAMHAAAESVPPASSVSTLEPALGGSAKSLEVPKEDNGQVAAALYRRGQQALGRGNVDEALQLFERAADLGSGLAAFALGSAYDVGAKSVSASGGVTPSVERARKWYRQAARLGVVEARQRLVALGASRVEVSKPE